MKDWVECKNCWAEFKIICDVDKMPEYCVFCASDLELEPDDEHDEDLDDYD